MTASKNRIREWIERGNADSATHLIVVCDTFSYDDYPVFVKAGQDARKIVAGYNNGEHPMQRVVEVYWLKGDLESQLKQECTHTYG